MLFLGVCDDANVDEGDGLELSINHLQESLLPVDDVDVGQLINDITRFHSQLSSSLGLDGLQSTSSSTRHQGALRAQATEELGITLLRVLSSDGARSAILSLRDEEARRVLDAIECVCHFHFSYMLCH
jgi:hypothetical protein